MAITCKVCASPDRAAIENAMLNGTLEDAAEKYGISVDDLKVHAILHSAADAEDKTESLARQLKLREAEVLSSVIDQYMSTLTTAGKKIAEYSVEDDFVRKITKPLVDLYIGMGTEIRSTVRVLAEMNNLINGPETGSSGLFALADAITSSRNKEG